MERSYSVLITGLSRLGHRFHRLLIVAVLAKATSDGAGLLSGFLHDEGGLAARARLGHRPVPQGEGAFRVAAAAVENLAAARPLLQQLAFVAFRALHPE